MRTALVIDDEEEMRQYLSRFIRRAGFEPLAAENARDGIEMCRARKPGVVFLDIMLPDMHGEAVFREIQSIDGNVSIYFVSGSESEIQRMKDMGLGAKGYLVKPIFIEQIKEILSTVGN